jgi:hypothetical protein
MILSKKKAVRLRGDRAVGVNEWKRGSEVGWGRGDEVDRGRGSEVEWMRSSGLG